MLDNNGTGRTIIKRILVVHIELQYIQVFHVIDHLFSSSMNIRKAMRRTCSYIYIPGVCNARPLRTQNRYTVGLPHVLPAVSSTFRASVCAAYRHAASAARRRHAQQQSRSAANSNGSEHTGGSWLVDIYVAWESLKRAHSWRTHIPQSCITSGLLLQHHSFF